MKWLVLGSALLFVGLVPATAKGGTIAQFDTFPPREQIMMLYGYAEWARPKVLKDPSEQEDKCFRTMFAPKGGSEEIPKGIQLIIDKIDEFRALDDGYNIAVITAGVIMDECKST